MESKSRSGLEFGALASVAESLQKEFVPKKNQWAGSRFKWASVLSSGAKGKLGKRLVNSWCAGKGLAIGPSPDSEADSLLNGRRVEIKFSLLWRSGIYKFQQIRDQNYEFLLCLGISPFEAHCWIVSKQQLKTHVIGKMGQHTGRGGKETAWFSVRPEKPPNWLLGCGGSLDDALKILKRIKTKKGSKTKK